MLAGGDDNGESSVPDEASLFDHRVRGRRNLRMLLQGPVRDSRFMFEGLRPRASAPALDLQPRKSRHRLRDLGAGRTQAAWSGTSGMDAARAPSGHGCPFGAGPRSVAGVRVFRRRRNITRSNVRINHMGYKKVHSHR